MKSQEIAEMVKITSILQWKDSHKEIAQKLFHPFITSLTEHCEFGGIQIFLFCIFFMRQWLSLILIVLSF